MKYIIIILLFTLCSNSLLAQNSGSGPFTLAAPANASNFQWFKDSVAIGGATDSLYDATEKGVYWVQYDLSPTTTCMDISTEYHIIIVDGMTDTTQLSGPSGYSSYQWYKDAGVIANENDNTYPLKMDTTAVGTYHLAYDNGSCTISTPNLLVYVLECLAGNIAPALSTTSVANTCPATTIDLDALHTGTIPTNTTLVWSTDNDASNGLASTETSPTSNAGTYYAYFHHTIDDCYSPASDSLVVTTANCIQIDTDGDGLTDDVDPDDDNDGIADTSETDDTDLDGIPDSLESNTIDTDGDMMADYNDNNADGEGTNDGTTGEQDGVETGPWNDTDMDGIPDHLDAANGAGGGTDITACGDSDSDGLSDCQECPDGFICPDSDGDNIPDYMDDFDNSASRLRLLCVNPLTEQVKIKNFTGTAIDISGYRLCTKFSYTGALSSEIILNGSLNLMPGAEVEIQITTLIFDDAAADLGLYLPTGAFTDAANMVDFTQWGSGGNGRESVAVTKGIWTAGTFISPNENPEFCYGDGDGVENGAINWKGNLVITPVDAGTPVTICADTTFSTDGPFTANDCGGNTSGTANPNGGGYTINASTGCITYTAPANPTTTTDTACVIICDANGICDTTQLVFPLNVPMGLDLNVKAFLGGAYDTNTGMMHDSLRAKGLMPMLQPYNGLSDFAYSGIEQVQAATLITTGANAIVDWVLVELRDATDPTVVIETKAGLIQRDGDIVAPDGIADLNFNSADGNYYIAIRHRNHLGAMTATAQTMNGTIPTTVDFTVSPMATYQLSDAKGTTHARQMLSDGAMVFWAGNYSNINNTGDRIIYQGVNSDIDDVFLKVITHPSNTQFLPVFIVQPTYDRADGNMDGRIILQGMGADQDQTFISVGLFPDNADNIPLYIIYEQIPR